ncbi:MAG: DUF2911 domain-containing protein [Gemmatimonadales bacterium]|nr:MAG: DUF2911 domain-containing protein [Gemmatimonadales bacterium]
MSLPVTLLLGALSFTAISHAGVSTLVPPTLPVLPTLAADSSTPTCEPVERMPLEGRASPYDSVATSIGSATVKICYGRPSARDRTMIGGEAVPFGQLWRTGANEATILHTTGTIQVGGVLLPEGSYSIYTIPGDESWDVFFSRSIGHWGLAIDQTVRDQEVGSAQAVRERPEEYVETFTIDFRDAEDGGTHLVMEWEEFRIRLPVEAGN